MICSSPSVPVLRRIGATPPLPPPPPPHTTVGAAASASPRPDPRILGPLSRAVVVAAERADTLEPSGEAFAQCKRELLRLLSGAQSGGTAAQPSITDCDTHFRALVSRGWVRRWSPSLHQSPGRVTDSETAPASSQPRPPPLPAPIPPADAAAVEAARARFPPVLRRAVAEAVRSEVTRDAEAELARRCIALLEALPRPIGAAEDYAEGAPARARLLLCAAAHGIGRCAVRAFLGRFCAQPTAIISRAGVCHSADATVPIALTE